MPSTTGNIAFKYGLQSAYSSATKDANTIYFTTDEQRIFVGDTEYTRPVVHGTTLPTGFLPPNSLFVLENNTARSLYYSKDGKSWDMVAKLNASIAAGVVGNNTAGSVAFGGSFKVPKVTYDARGNITAAQDVTITLPAKPSETKNTVTVSGNGNAVTAASFDTAGHALTLTKGETFATQATVDGIAAKPAMDITTDQITNWDNEVGAKAIANAAVKANTAITGATHTKITYDAKGLVTAGADLAASDIPNLAASKITSGTFAVDRIPTITTAKISDAGAAAKKGVATEVTAGGTDLPTAGAVQTAINSAISGVTQFDIIKVDAYDKLPTTGTKGVIYLVPHTHGSNDSFDEYIWNTTTTTPAYEKIGNTDVDLSGYVPTSRKVNGQALTSDITITTITGNAGSASKVNNALTIDGTEFDGSKAVTISTAKSVSSLTDTTITSAANGNSLVYNGTAWVNKTLTKADVGLGNVNNTADSAKSVASAAKLTTARTITLAGDATGSVSFDGSKDVSITVTGVKAAADGAGNNIVNTYATKTELSNAALKWQAI